MAPFYLETGGKISKLELKSEPEKIKNEEGRELDVAVSEIADDPEAIRVSVLSDERIHVTGQFGSSFYPGRNIEICNSGFTIKDATTREQLAKVFYSKKTIELE